MFKFFNNFTFLNDDLFAKCSTSPPQLVNQSKVSNRHRFYFLQITRLKTHKVSEPTLSTILLAMQNKNTFLNLLPNIIAPCEPRNNYTFIFLFKRNFSKAV